MNEIEALKEELRQTKLAYLMATQMSQFKSGFLARTAHELRSPLSSLIGLHQIILFNLCENPQEEREFLVQSFEATQKLIKLLDDLIAVSKIDYGAIALEIRPVQLTQIFSELNQLTNLQAKNRRLTLEILSPPSDFFVMADYQRFLQVLINLVDTNVSYLKDGKIRISAFIELSSQETKGCIDIDCPVNIWKEPSDLLQQTSEKISISAATREEIKSLSQNITMSPGMKFWVAQTLLEAMGGHLKILELSPEEVSEKVTRLRCWIPLAPAEVVALILAED
jgi:signal transduction histidine kinase